MQLTPVVLTALTSLLLGTTTGIPTPPENMDPRWPQYDPAQWSPIGPNDTAWAATGKMEHSLRLFLSNGKTMNHKWSTTLQQCNRLPHEGINVVKATMMQGDYGKHYELFYPNDNSCDRRHIAFKGRDGNTEFGPRGLNIAFWKVSRD